MNESCPSNWWEEVGVEEEKFTRGKTSMLQRHRSVVSEGDETIFQGPSLVLPNDGLTSIPKHLECFTTGIREPDLVLNLKAIGRISSN